MKTIERHLEWCQRRELRPSYVEAIRWTLTRCRRSVGPLEHASEDQILGWWENLEVTAASRVAYGAHLSSFYRWALREKLRSDDPTVRFDRPRLRRNLPRPMGTAYLRQAIDFAPAPLRGMLLLAAYQGLRAMEIANLHRDDLTGEILIVRDGKGGKQRVLPLHPTVAAELEDYPAEGWIFPSRQGDGPMRPNTISARVNRYLHQEVGTPDTLHQARHWFGTTVYQQSLDLRLTQELMGHADPKTTAGYAAWEPEKAVGIIGRLKVAGPLVAIVGLLASLN